MMSSVELSICDQFSVFTTGLQDDSDFDLPPCRVIVVPVLQASLQIGPQQNSLSLHHTWKLKSEVKHLEMMYQFYLSRPSCLWTKSTPYFLVWLIAFAQPGVWQRMHIDNELPRLREDSRLTPSLALSSTIPRISHRLKVRRFLGTWKWTLGTWDYHPACFSATERPLRLDIPRV
jgi:hypothetical protein